MRASRGLPLRVELVGAALAEIVPVTAGIECRQIAPEGLEAAAATDWADLRLVDLDAGSGVIAALARAADPQRTVVTVAVSRNPAHAPVALAAGASDFALLPRDRGWLDAAILRERERRRASAAGPERLIVEIPSRGLSLAEFERRVVEHALERAGWNRSRAARELGISRPRLQRKIERYGLVPLAGA